MDKLSARDKALAGWRSRLAALVVGVLVVQSITGLWTYLAPFSLSAQLQVLLHTALGLAILLPLAVHQVRHVRAWWGQTMTATMALGYALLVAVVACAVSGLVVTWQSLFGTRMDPLWDRVHLVSGIATTILLVVHLAMAVLRRSAASFPELRPARRVFTAWSGGVVLASAFLVGVGTLLAPTRPTTFEAPEHYTMPEYALTPGSQYENSPFAPSSARTEGMLLVDPAVLSGSESCGTVGCHEEIVAEWLPSAHRFAAMNAPFRAVQERFAEDRSPADTRYCAGCHDPISLFAGAKDPSTVDLAAPGAQEGISCIVCHTMSKADTRGNADYVLTPPQEYLFTGEDGWRKAVGDFLIRAYPRQHLADYDRNLLRTPESCAACHKQFIPEELNFFGQVGGQNQYDEWKNGHWHTDDAETDLSCTDCHMRLVADSRDPGAGEGGELHRSRDDGAHRHHGFIGTNNFMPAVLDLPGWEKHVALTNEWIRGETVLPEIDDRWPRGPVASVSIQGLSEAAEPGEELSFRLVVVNEKAGHNFITGPLDFVRSWVHLTVRDSTGRVIDERGAIDPETRHITDRRGQTHASEPDPVDGTLVLQALPVDPEGNVLEQHELWRKAGGKDKRVVFPRHSDSHTVRIAVPPDAVGPLTVEAELNYRRYRQRFLDLVVPRMEAESGVLQPTVVQASTSAVVPLKSEEAE